MACLLKTNEMFITSSNGISLLVINDVILVMNDGIFIIYVT